MSTSQNLKASLTKPAITQQTITQCNNSFKVFLRASDKKSLKTWQSRCMTRWRKRQLVLLPLNTLSTPCTSNQQGTPLLDLTSKQTGKHKDNTSKVTKANNLNDKGLARLPSTPLLPQDHGTINQSQWTSIEWERQGGTGEDEGEGRKEGM